MITAPELWMPAPVDTLSTAQRRGAMFTGLWAMPLMAAGLVVSVLPGVVFVLVVLIFLVGGLLVGGGVVGALFIGMLSAMAGGMWIVAEPWLVIVPFVVGLAAFFGGYLGSVRSLRRLGIRSPRKSTWSAFAVGFAIQVTISFFVYAVVFIVGSLVTNNAIGLTMWDDDANILAGPGWVFHGIMLLVTIGIGMLFWPVFARISQRRALAKEAALAQWRAEQAYYSAQRLS